jgi:hypothetical protein
VRIAESYWSPVLCATVARVVGPPGTSLAALVPRVPAGATAAPNDVYATAAVTLRPAPPLPAQPAPAPAPAISAPDPYRSLQYGLDRLGADDAWLRSRGAGVRIALLDSAPEVAHRDLAGIALAEIEGGPGTAPATHDATAGVRGGDNGFPIAAAPEAELIAVPVCTPAGASAWMSVAFHVGAGRPRLGSRRGGVEPSRRPREPAPRARHGALERLAPSRRRVNEARTRRATRRRTRR